MRRIGAPSPAMLVAIAALVVALVGSAYAAVNLPANSVGTKQLKQDAVTARKLADGAVSGAKVVDGSLLGRHFASGQIPAGPPGIRGPEGPKGEPGPQGPAGMARNVGIIDGGVNPTFEPGVRGWRAITRIGVGSYCLRPDPSTELDNSALMLSLGRGGGGFSARHVIWSGVCGFAPFEYNVDVLDADGFSTDDVDFTAIAP